MQASQESSTSCFSTSFPVTVYTRLAGGGPDDWRVLDRGPGYFTIPEGEEASVRIHSIDNDDLNQLVKDLADCPQVVELTLAENRKITDSGLEVLRTLKWLSSLNVSSCNLSNTGVGILAGFRWLKRLNLSYQPRITDVGIKQLRSLDNLEYLDLQGCPKVTHGGVARLGRPGLEIHE